MNHGKLQLFFLTFRGFKLL